MNTNKGTKLCKYTILVIPIFKLKTIFYLYLHNKMIILYKIPEIHASLNNLCKKNRLCNKIPI